MLFFKTTYATQQTKPHQTIIKIIYSTAVFIFVLNFLNKYVTWFCNMSHPIYGTHNLFFSPSKIERGASSRACVVTVMKSYDSSVIYVPFYLYSHIQKKIIK